MFFAQTVKYLSGLFTLIELGLKQVNLLEEFGDVITLFFVVVMGLFLNGPNFQDCALHSLQFLSCLPLLNLIYVNQLVHLLDL